MVLWSHHNLKKKKKVTAYRNGSHQVPQDRSVLSDNSWKEESQAESDWNLKGAHRRMILFWKNGSDRIGELESRTI